MSAIVEMTPSFQIVNTWFGRTVIHSQKRFTYEEAFEVLENGGQHKDILQTLNKIAKNLRSKRMQAGALSLESDEIKFALDEFGFPIGIMRKVRNDAHKLVEEFMLLANAIVAEELGKNKAEEMNGAMLYRIHDKPTIEKMENLSAFMQSLGHTAELKKGVVPSHVLAQAIADTDDETIKEVIQSIIIRSQQKAIYSSDNKGHFGLALEYYTHFTSPIRRYPDVVIHRLLEETTTHKKISGREKKSFADIASHSSMREVDAQEAERASDKYYQTLYMRDKVGQVLSGTVTGLNDRGLFVRDDVSYSEGFVRFKDQYSEKFIFNKKNYTATGEKTGVAFAMGDKVKVKVTDVRPDRREIDFSLLKEEAQQD
ncbi:MAG: ribonuclease [Candidatus Parcubacteria bacterium]|jgi:ribonuclease R